MANLMNAFCTVLLLMTMASAQLAEISVDGTQDLLRNWGLHEALGKEFETFKFDGRFLNILDMSDFNEKKFPSAMKAHWKVLIDEIENLKTEHARRRLKSTKPDTSGFKGVRIKSDNSLISLGAKQDVQLVRTAPKTLSLFADNFKLGIMSVKKILLNGADLTTMLSASGSHFACATGWAGKKCDKPDPCNKNNGGCHSKRKCDSSSGKIVCKACTDGMLKDGATGCKAPAIPQSCQEVLMRNPKAKSGKYTLKNAGVTFDTYCLMEGKIGWTKVIGVNKDNRDHCTDLSSKWTNLGANGYGKLSDKVINALTGTEGVLRATQTAPRSKTIYFRKTTGLWDFNGAAKGGQGNYGSNANHDSEQCSTSYPGPKWVKTGGHSNHYGFSTYPNNCGGGNWNYCENGKSHKGAYDNGKRMTLFVYATSTPKGPCHKNNGGCHSKRKCDSSSGKVVCKDCTQGWTKDGATGCKAPKAFPQSCQDVLMRNPKAKSATYTLTTAGVTFETYCLMQGKIGWTKVIGVNRDNRDHCTDLRSKWTNLGADGYGKLSDKVINALTGTEGVLRATQTAPRSKTIYFRKTKGLWDFNGAAKGGQGNYGSNAKHDNEQCSTSYPGPKWVNSGGHSNHYGFSTYPNNCGGGNWNYCENGKSHKGAYDNGKRMTLFVYATSTPKGGSGGKPKNCQEILNANSKAKSGKYTIYPTSSMSVTTYCSMEGKMGWTKIIGVSRSTRAHCSDQAESWTNYGPNGYGKLSDKVINALTGNKGVIRATQTAPRSRTFYFRKTKGLWDFNGAAKGGQGNYGSNAKHDNEQCSTSYPGGQKWVNAPGHSNHYGFSTYPNNCGGGNWNYCENGKQFKGGYDNGKLMSMQIYMHIQ